MRLAMALSGGVDSATAASLLLDAGHQLIGVTMHLCGSVEGAKDCSTAESVRDARRVADVLGFPFHVVDRSQEFRTRVLDPAREAYRAGRTPNPCVECNATVKLDVDAALAELGVEVDGVATGHYARVAAEGGRFVLRKGVDPGKDQSYFLCRLTQRQLGRTHFPLGELTKPRVRHMAAERSLPVATKGESQDFLGGEYRLLFGDEERPGPILDQAGHEVGRHRGVHLYTIGQRRGLGVAHAHKLYVTALDVGRDAVIVGPVENLAARVLEATDVNWVAAGGFDAPDRVRARIRYRHREQPATAVQLAANRVRVEFDKPQQAITPGQTLALYDGDLVLAGGTIDSVQ
jgi:tRNA-specific 2-thiouridylase